ncbi:hypothetical protein FB480_102637 [Agrobacterium vitis]|nr:hypothetical protein FB480_102637 [Agrobacterium vitis]
MRSAGLILAQAMMFSVLLSCPAHAERPDGHGGGRHGEAGGPRGADGPRGFDGPRGSDGPKGSEGRNFSHGPDERGAHDQHQGRGKRGFRSHWNEEGFFDNDRSELDHQRALAGVKSGRYRSLKQIIRMVGIAPSSRIVGMDLRSRDGIDVYSIVVRDAAGHVERMTVKAETGERID